MRFAIWFGLAAIAPLPLLGLHGGAVPVGRMLWLGGWCLAVMLAENANGVAPILFAMFVGQALLWGILLWVAASGAERVLRRIPTPLAFALVLLAVTGLAFALADRAVYRTPYAASERATLRGLYR
jgi:hypothetical protein